jgi:hypothetical protein
MKIKKKLNGQKGKRKGEKKYVNDERTHTKKKETGLIKE